MPRRIVECRWARSPFVVGVVRPALVLPMGWAVDGKVVLHELLHLKYRDVWAGWLTTALRCLHWCNPFLWFVFDKIGNDRESLCDQRVLERLEGEERRDYGRGAPGHGGRPGRAHPRGHHHGQRGPGGEGPH